MISAIRPRLRSSRSSLLLLLLLRACVLVVVVVSVLLLVTIDVKDATIMVEAASRVRLRDVEALTFERGAWTTSRRVSAVLQMQCENEQRRVSSCDYAPSTMMCRNVGWSGTAVQWHCDADVPHGVRLTHVRVSCEGYDNAQDEYVLAGSCGVSFRLAGSPSGPNSHAHNRNSDSDGDSDSAFPLLFFVLLAVFVWWVWRSPAHAQGDAAAPAYDDDDRRSAPPPYSSSHHPPPPPYPGQDRPRGGNSYGDGGGGGGGFGGFAGMRARPAGSTTYTYTRAPPAAAAAAAHTATNSGPGFWTGMGAGALLSYLFTRPDAPPYRQQHQHFRPQTRSWFSWDTANHGYDRQPAAAAHSFWSTPASSSSSSSSSTSTSSAYGSTSNR